MRLSLADFGVLLLLPSYALAAYVLAATTPTRPVDDVASSEMLATRAEVDTSQQQHLIPRTFKLLGTVIDAAPATATVSEVSSSVVSPARFNDAPSDTFRLASQPMPDAGSNDIVGHSGVSIEQPRYRASPFHLPDLASGGVFLGSKELRFPAPNEALAIQVHRSHGTTAPASVPAAPTRFFEIGESSSKASLLEQSEAPRRTIVQRKLKARKVPPKRRLNLNKIPKPPPGSGPELAEEYRMAVYLHKRLEKERYAALSPEEKTRLAALKSEANKKYYHKTDAEHLDKLSMRALRRKTKNQAKKSLLNEA